MRNEVEVEEERKEGEKGGGEKGEIGGEGEK
jgi:hypothetical protein